MANEPTSTEESTEKRTEESTEELKEELKEEITETSSSSKGFSKITKILLTLFLFFVVVYTLTYAFFPTNTEKENMEESTALETEVDGIKLLEPTLSRESYIRPDYNSIDFYTALQSLGFELDFLYEDLKDYYAKGEAIGKTLDELREDRQFILTTLDNIVQKDVNNPDSALNGESVELMYTLDEAIHYLDQIIYLLGEDKDQLSMYQYNQAKEKISSFDYTITYIISLREQYIKDAEQLEEENSEAN